MRPEPRFAVEVSISHQQQPSPPPAHPKGLTPVDRVRPPHDGAGAALPEYLPQVHQGQQLTLDGGAQGGARSHWRQLVRVPHYHHLGAGAAGGVGGGGRGGL